MTEQALSLHPSPEQLYAAVDLGSNSFHMVVVRVDAGNVQIIGKVKQKVRLAAGLDEQMMLDDLSMERGWQCLETFAERLLDIPPANVKVVGTATLRLANNADVFITKAEKILGHKLRVISGEEEARQIYLGVAYTSANCGNTLVIDIGGASTEIIIGNDMNPIHLTSLDMGCVTFMERYFAGGVLSEENFGYAVAAAHALIGAVREEFVSFDWQQCLGASGTPQAITEILVAQGISDSIRLPYLLSLKQQCIDAGQIDLLSIQGLAESRRPIFPSGLAILLALFESLGIEQMQISGGALREGLIYGMLDNMQQNDRRKQTLATTIQRFHIDKEQARRVSELALALYKQMCTQVNICNFDAQAVLAAAATLHEAGLHIEYKKYHEHGAYILRHLPLAGYSLQQRKAIVDLVGSHRQDIQKELILNYPEDKQELMRSLMRLLRLAHILSIRRKDDILPVIELNIEGDAWVVSFPDGWLKHHPLIDAELANEKWLQHKAGWLLEFK